MVVVTGGAGFIGSALVCALNDRGINDIVIVDHLGTSEKWKNIRGLRFSRYLDKQQFITDLEEGRFSEPVEAVFHLGACSSTTENNADYLIENNCRYTERLALWWEQHQKTRFIYASSAATYGDGSRGYSDDESMLDNLRPLNMYGYSKHLFDLHAKRKGWLGSIAGLKYFNVFGPNEYHKGSMRSVINKAFPKVRDEGVITLFKSYRHDYKHGEQLRDFIYVKDAVAMTLFFYDNPSIGGIFNIGTGKARTWNDVGHALFAALKKKPVIEYCDMPEELQGKYQYFTEADLGKLQRAGYTAECRPLEASIEDYAVLYLSGYNHLEAGKQDTWKW